MFWVSRTWNGKLDPCGNVKLLDIKKASNK